LHGAASLTAPVQLWKYFMPTERQTNRITNPDQLAQHEEIGRKIAAALEPLGFSPAQIQAAAAAPEHHRVAVSLEEARRMSRVLAATRNPLSAKMHARVAGVAAYFKAQAAKLDE
jgi:hypothetical protein